MMRYKFFRMCAILAGIAIAGVVSPVRADFALEYSINGGAFTVVTGTGTGTVDDPYSAFASIGGLTIVASGSGSTTMQSSSLDLSVGGSEAKNTTITILVSMTGVLTAPPPESLDATMGNGIDTGSGGNKNKPGSKITMADYLSQSNALFDTTTAVVGPLNVAPSTTVTNNASVSLTPNYSWTLETTLDNSSNGYSTNSMSTDNNGTLSATPAPAGLVLLASALPVLGGTWWRRRKAQQTR
jgi:hypothetical protein